LKKEKDAGKRAEWEKKWRAVEGSWRKKGAFVPKCHEGSSLEILSNPLAIIFPEWAGGSKLGLRFQSMNVFHIRIRTLI